MTASLVCRDFGITFPSGFRVGPADWPPEPELHHVAAANGTGQTALLRCLCGAWRGSTGTLSICGRDPRTEAAARRHVSFVAADPELPPFLTVDEAWRELA